MLKKIDGIEQAVNEIATLLTDRATALEAELKPYISGVVTEETQKDWKKERARLNKERTSTKKERTTMEADWKGKLAPISDIYKAMDSEYGKAIDNIDRQLAEFENARVAKKLEEIAETFNLVCESHPRLEPWFPFINMSIIDDKWKNAGVTISSIKKEMEDAMNSLEIGMDTIISMNTKYERYAIDKLMVTGSLSEAIAKINELVEMEKRVEEANAELTKPAEDPKPVEEIPPVMEEDFFAYEELVTYSITFPASRRDEVEIFLRSIGAEWNE